MATDNRIPSQVPPVNQQANHTIAQRACLNCGAVFDARDLGGRDRHGPVWKFRLPGTSVNVLLCACGEVLHFYTTVGVEADRHPSRREMHYAHKRAAVNHVARRVHANGGLAADEDLFILANIPGPVPPPDPIDVASEVSKLRNALLSTHAEEKGLWCRAPGKFRWATRRRYRLKEISSGRVALHDGKDGPQVTVGTILRPQLTWVLNRTGLNQALEHFVKEAHPGLPDRIEPQVEDPIPF